MSLLGMTKTVLKNLFTRPATERYPYVAKEYLTGARGKVDIEIEKCIFCGICQRKCPTAAIAVTKDPKVWTIDRLRCVSCNACVEVCPKKCLALNVKYSACVTKRSHDAFSPEKTIA
jgi:formate hydrogenlyase subunit 6/NADH:ubiquinone oxidoreductase subunit I